MTNPRRILWAMAAACLGLLAFGLYLQHALGLEPCPMCIVQRYVLVLIAVVCAATAWPSQPGVRRVGCALIVLLAAAGAFVAGRQSWLQWHPPQVATCGRDLYGMIEAFPLQRVIPMVFRGSGDCAQVDWTFLGGSIANWSFVCFVTLGLLAAGVIWRDAKK